MVTYTYTALVDPLAPTGIDPRGINESDAIVGNYADSGGIQHGFVYNNGVYTTLDDPLATNGTVALGINDSGQIVGNYTDSDGVHGFVYNNGVYATLDDPLATDGTVARGINDSGQVVGSYTDSGGIQHGFVYNNGVYTTLDDPLATNGTVASGINNSGEIVGYYTNSGGSALHGFVYNNGVYTTLDDPLATNGTVALGINNLGQILGYYDDSGGQHGFIYSNGVYTTLNDPLATAGTTTLGINNAGQAVGYYSAYGDPKQEGFLAAPTIIVINSVADLENINNNLSGHYVLGANIDASGFNFTPIGDSQHPFTGTFDGQGHIIDQLTINSSNPYVGLFGDVASSATISNIGLTNTAISSNAASFSGNYEGALAGFNNGTIINAYSTGAVSYSGPGSFNSSSSGSAPIWEGGLVGYSAGNIQWSYSTASVSATTQGAGNAGGLVGENSGGISNSYATGHVDASSSLTSGSYVGGLAAYNVGSIIESSASGNVTASSGSILLNGPDYRGVTLLGGLVALNDGTISQSSEVGSVTGNLSVAGYYVAGGLVGLNANTVTNSYATGAVTALIDGGLIGVTYPGTTIGESYSIGSVFGTFGGSYVGGAVGLVYLGGTGAFSNNYWDTDTSGLNVSWAALPETTAQLKAGLPAGFDPTIWGINSNINNGFPYLLWQVHAPVIDTAHSVVTGTVNELPFVTGSSAIDSPSPGSFSNPGTILFTDSSLTTTTATVLAETVVYKDAHGNDDTNILTAAQIATLEQAFSIALTTNSTQGTVDWTYSIPDKQLDFLGVGETLTITAPVQINDGQGNTTTQNVVITINGADDNPVANPVTAKVENSYTVTSGAATGVLANDSDPDIHDTLYVSTVNGLSGDVGHSITGKYGTLTLNADGSYSYVENTIGKLLSALNISMDDTFSYTVSDGHGGTASSTLTFDTRESAPPVAKADSVTVAEGATITENAANGVLVNDSDPNGYSLSVSAVNGHSTSVGHAIQGADGTLTLNADGSYSYVEASTNIPSNGAQDVFNYTVSDGHGGTATSSLTVHITPPPSLAEYFNAAQAVYNDNAVGTTVNANTSGLTLVLDSRNPLLAGSTSWLSSGFFAQAFEDSHGNVIIAFEGTVLNLNPLTQTPFEKGVLGADVDIALGITPGAFADAISFTQDVLQFLVDFNQGSAPVYLTGHSLGGAEAEYVASVDHESGVTFGAPGALYPTYSPVAGQNFINYVDYGDPIGNFGHHFGTVQPVGSPHDAVGGNPIYASTIGVIEATNLYHRLEHYQSDFTPHELSSAPVISTETALIGIASFPNS